MLSDKTQNHVVLGTANEGFLVGDTTEPGVVDVALSKQMLSDNGQVGFATKSHAFAVGDAHEDRQFAERSNWQWV